GARHLRRARRGRLGLERRLGRRYRHRDQGRRHARDGRAPGPVSVMNDELATERRLEREALTHCCGTLGVPLAEPSAPARVEVSWTNEHGTDHAGFYFVNVVCREVVQVGLDGASRPMRRWRDELDKAEHLRHVVTDDDELANHPATLASEIAR